MKPELQAYLDGELDRSEVPVELRQEAARWERLFADMSELDPASEHRGFEGPILSSLPQHRRGTLRRAASWVARPRTVRISPLAGLAAAAAVAFIVLLWPGGEDAAPGRGPQDGATIYVQFVLEAPAATSVAVAGDFTGWTSEIGLTDPDGDGIWTGRVALKPGVHQYMFVIDGTEWRTDPNADRYTDDGFGNRNAVLVIGRPAARS